jgi:hypothetical protein
MRRWGAPIAALLIARLVSGAAAVWVGLNPLRAETWVRFDSNLYLEIARKGYTLFTCPPESGYPPSQWCGNAGWFPLYSWLGPGALLSLALEAAFLVLLWRLLLQERSFGALVLAALFPGSIYQQAVFPVSLLLVCAVCFLAGIERGRDAPAAVAGALGAMSYPTGLLLAPVAVARRAIWPALAVIAGAAVVLAVMRHQTGRWDAALLVQSKYSYAYGFGPLDTLFSRLKPLVNARYRTPATFAAGAQTLLVLSTLALSARSWRARPAVAAYCLLYWAFPLCLGGKLSLYRAEALLAPMVVLLPPRAASLLLLAAAPIAFAMDVAFFRGALT